MRKIIIALALLLIWFLVCFIINEFFSIEKKPNDPLTDIQDTLIVHNADIDRFINILTEEGISRGSWIERKEIASWSAALLLFSILMLLFRNIETLKKHSNLIMILVIFLLILFCLFIHQQFGALTNGMAIKQSMNFWIYKAIQDNKVPSEFDFTIESNLDFPTSIQKTIKIQQKRIRSHCFLCRLALPYLYIPHKIKTFLIQKDKSKDKDDMLKCHAS